MLKDIVSANPLGDYCLHLRFEDGVEGVVDLRSAISFQGVFAPLHDPGYFAQVSGVNYFSRLATTISPDQRPLHCWQTAGDLLDWG